ncbi:MAG: TSUP family transporter, partial [Candidatus Limnocylindrales bacterium]
MTPGADLAIFGISIAAGVLGALAGIGGGMLVIPALTMLFGVDIRVAIGASIVSIIATSSGAAAAYVRDRLTNLRVGMFLELATTSGAVIGALLAAVVAANLLYTLLGVVLLFSAAMQVVRLREELPPESPPSAAARALGLVSSYPDARLGREVPYAARRIGLGFVAMGVAGLLSGLLGIGSGALKVL